MRLTVMDVALDGKEPEHPILKLFRGRHEVYIEMLEERLGQAKYLAGGELSAADIMTIYSLTTNRGFRSVDLTGRNNILAYLQRVAQRDGYKRAREKGDAETPPLINAKVERFQYGSFQKLSKA